jgi:predicted outer membrane lipoprotein
VAPRWTHIALIIVTAVSILLGVGARRLWDAPVNKLIALGASLVLAVAFSLVNRLFLQHVEIDSVAVIFVMTTFFIIVSQLKPMRSRQTAWE